MNQLSGKYVNVVLSVECGRGMDFLKNNVYIVANFNSRILESDHIPPEENPPFNTELVWEIEKKELRKIRSANLPLRVECITIDSQSRKERIGFALLSLRSAQIIPECKANEPLVPSWYKLIGCQADKRKSHPELYLSLSLRDHLDQVEPEKEDERAVPFIMEEETQNVEEPNQADCSVKYYENGHIRIGDESVAKLPFMLNVLVKSIFNLDALLPEALVFQSTGGSYFLTFKILGIIIKTKPFKKWMHSYITLNEKIVVNLLSEKEILEEFLKTQTITVSFYYRYDKLGFTKFSCKNFWNKEEQTYFFKFPSTNGIVPFGSTNKSPYITLETWIEQTDENQLTADQPSEVPEEVVDKPKARSIFSNICKRSAAAAKPATYNDTINTEEPPADSKSEYQIIPFTTKSVDTVVINEPLTTRPNTFLDVYQKFVVVVSLKYLVWITPPQNTKVMFKFLHPRAGSCTTIFTELSNIVQHEIALNNLYVRIGYISTMDKISKLLRYWYPKLVLADENEIIISDQRPLNVSCLEYENSSKDYEIECRHYRTGMFLCKIGVNTSIRLTDTKLEDDYENLYLLPIVVDEIITVREITDLMEWKKDNKEQFEKMFEQTKQEEISRLQKEYQAKKVELDEKVTKTVNKCKELQNGLKSKLAKLKIEKQLMKMQSNSSTYDEIYQNNYKEFAEENTPEIIALLSKIQADNEVLKKLVEEHQEKLSQMEKSTSTMAETTNLLQELKVLEERFSQAQVAKNFFQKHYKAGSNGETNEINVQDNSKNMENQDGTNLFSLNKISDFSNASIIQEEIIESTSDEASY